MKLLNILKSLTAVTLAIASNHALAWEDCNNETDECQTKASTATTTRPLNFSIDRRLSMHVGSNLAQSALWGYQFLDDTLISGTEGDEKIITMTARLGKSIVEYSLASWLMVAQHEMFGHGARAREFHMSNVTYKVYPFSGSTSFSSAEYNQLNSAEKIALTTGGMESTTLLAHDLRDNWLHDSAIDIRAAQLYLTTYLDQTSYILGTSDSNTTSGNDVTSYVNSVNTWHNSGNDTITKHKLRNRTSLDFFDPFLVYSIFGIVNYIATGEQQYDYYMLPIGGFKYLPSFRTVLAPWGTEWQFSNYIKNPADQLLYVGIRSGSTGDRTSYGLTVKLSELFIWNDVSFDARADVWKQPDLKAASLTTAKNPMGIAGFTTASYKPNQTLKVFGQLGYKTSGFIQGEPLNASLIVRAGVGFNL